MDEIDTQKLEQLNKEIDIGLDEPACSEAIPGEEVFAEIHAMSAEKTREMKETSLTIESLKNEMVIALRKRRRVRRGLEILFFEMRIWIDDGPVLAERTAYRFRNGFVSLNDRLLRQ